MAKVAAIWRGQKRIAWVMEMIEYVMRITEHKSHTLNVETGQVGPVPEVRRRAHAYFCVRHRQPFCPEMN